MAVVEEQIVKPYHQTERLSLFQGDCREAMKSLSDNSVDSIVTDPPYELTANKRGGTGAASLNLNSPAGRARVTTGFMGQRWDGTGAPFDADTWIECLRVLKPGGHLLAFGGSRTYHRLACAIEDAGFEIRDQIQWLYGSGFPKSLDVSKAIDAAAGAEREVTGVKPGHEAFAGRGNLSSVQSLHDFGGGGFSRPWMDDPTQVERYHMATAPATDAAKQWNGWGTALKPAHEPIVLARKPLIGTVAENVLKHGTGGLNIDGCRIETGNDLNGGRYRGVKQGDDGSVFGSGINQQSVNAYRQPIGRWPANVIHDGSEEVSARFPETASAAMRYEVEAYEGNGATAFLRGRSGPNNQRQDSGSAARFFYTAKATQEDRNEGLESLPHRVADETHKRPRTELDDPRRDGVTPRQNYHPTVKPTDLMRYLCRLITPPGGLVLDPFCGSGSTGKAAMLEGFKFIGIELNADYCQLARLRIEAVTRQGLLFA